MALKNTKVLNGDMIWEKKLYSGINSLEIFNEVAIFRQFTVFIRKPIWHKSTQKCFMEMKCVSHNIIEYATPIGRVLHI